VRTSSENPQLWVCCGLRKWILTRHTDTCTQRPIFDENNLCRSLRSVGEQKK